MDSEQSGKLLDAAVSAGKRLDKQRSYPTVCPLKQDGDHQRQVTNTSQGTLAEMKEFGSPLAWTVPFCTGALAHLNHRQIRISRLSQLFVLLVVSLLQSLIPQDNLWSC